MRTYLLLFGAFLFGVVAQQVNEVALTKYLRCLTCKATIDEVESLLAKIDPTLEVEVGGFRIDAKGNNIQKKVPLSRSEAHIYDLLDGLCEKFSDYVIGTHKTTGEIVLLNLIDSSGFMNPEMSNVDIVQDIETNKISKYHCEALLDEYEDSLVQLIRSGDKSLKENFCFKKAQVCKNTEPFTVKVENNENNNNNNKIDENYDIMDFFQILFEKSSEMKIGFIVATALGYFFYRMAVKNIRTSQLPEMQKNEKKLDEKVANDYDNYKLVLVIRTDLKMGKGKIAAQCAHAAVAAYKSARKHPQMLKAWEDCGQPKITVKVDSEEALVNVAKLAKDKGILTNIVRDAGRTQIPSNSKTVCGIGPGPAPLIDEVTGELKLF
ncbi:uncharacterized protein [Prorops nasuta]|uniref:uncharacterized protein isoform X2 n=1 Tax=Prorops nasuta TaxID=863751 RepID=UPI0034CE4097